MTMISFDKKKQFLVYLKKLFQNGRVKTYWYIRRKDWRQGVLLVKSEFSNSTCTVSEVFSEPYQTSKMKRFAKIFNG